MKVLDLEFEEELIYTIVGSAEATCWKTRFPMNLLLGRPVGSKVGDVVEIAVPAGQLNTGYWKSFVKTINTGDGSEGGCT